MSYCANWSGVLTAETGDGRVLVAPTRCKLWSCPVCVNLNRKIWTAKLIHGINEIGGDWSFWTITAHRLKRGFDQSLDNLRLVWRKLYYRLKRKFGGFHYARIMECHRDSSVHWHFVSTISWTDVHRGTARDGRELSYSRWLKDTVPSCGGGFEVDTRNIEGHPGAVAGYIVKYMTKESGLQREMRGRVRRIQTSQKWPKKSLTDDNGDALDWQLRSALFLDTAAKYWRAGVAVVDITTGEHITSDHYLDAPYYPPPRES